MGIWIHNGPNGREDLDTELDFHFAETVEGLVAKGWSETAARGEAERRFGSRSRYRQSLKHIQQTIKWRDRMRTLFSIDIRSAVRSLRATPVITAVAILSLALGVGANTALFSIMNGLMIRPLPVPHPEQLMLLEDHWTNPIWEQIRDRLPVAFQSAFAWSDQRFDLSEAGERDHVDGAYVSGGFFQTLGIGVALGRTLTTDDDARGGGRDGAVAVISHAFWQNRFGGKADVIGRRLLVNHTSFNIVGVAPRGFMGPEVGRAAHIFLPISAEARIKGPDSSLDHRSSWWLTVMLRVKPDSASGGTSQPAVTAVALRLNEVRPAIREATMPTDWPPDVLATYLKEDFTLVSAATGSSSLRTRFAQPLTVIMIVVLGVLLIACANIASLMLARASARRGEMSLRMALGASRFRLTRQLLVEGLLLAAAGSVAGLVFAQWGGALLVRQLGSAVSTIAIDLSIDWRVLLFTGGVAMATTLLFGLAPAAGLSNVRPIEAIESTGRGTHSDHHFGMRNALVIAQLAMSVVLVVGAVLFMRTFHTLTTTPLGFTPDRLLIVNVDSRSTGVAPEQRLALYQHITDAAAATPGVRRASPSFLTPVSGGGWNNDVSKPERADLPPRERMTFQNAVAPGWFDTFGMRLLSGRDVSAQDTAGSARVAVVNETFVRKFLGAAPPIGQEVVLGRAPRTERYTIVGVVNDAIYRSVRAGVPPTLFMPLAQSGQLGASFALTVQAEGDSQSVVAHLRQALSRADPRLAFSFRDYSDQLGASVARERLVAVLSGFFGGLAVLLAGLGLYGVTSYSVHLRRPEMAVRLALGANTGGIERLVLRRVGALVLVGIVIGVGLSFWAGSFVSALLFRVEARDPLTFVAAVMTLAAVGLLAGWLPARRAARLDPNVVLRR